jgi:hypothetical protein
LFEPGSTLEVTIQGQDAANYPTFGHRKLVNRGVHRIFTGGQYHSSLTVPLNTSASIGRSDSNPGTLAAESSSKPK